MNNDQAAGRLSEDDLAYVRQHAESPHLVATKLKDCLRMAVQHIDALSEALAAAKRVVGDEELAETLRMLDDKGTPLDMGLERSTVTQPHDEWLLFPEHYAHLATIIRRLARELVETRAERDEAKEDIMTLWAAIEEREPILSAQIARGRSAHEQLSVWVGQANEWKTRADAAEADCLNLGAEIKALRDQLTAAEADATDARRVALTDAAQVVETMSTEGAAQYGEHYVDGYEDAIADMLTTIRSLIPKPTPPTEGK